MKEFKLTTNELLDYLIKKLVKGEEVYIDLITSEISTDFLCLKNIRRRADRLTEAHRLLDCLRDKPLLIFGKDIEYSKLMGDLYNLPIGNVDRKTFIQIGNPDDGYFAQTFYPMTVLV